MAGASVEDAIDVAIGLLVIGLLAAYLLPIAIDELVNTSQVNWGSAEKGLWDLLPLFLVFGAVLFVIGIAVNAYKSR